MPNRTTRKNQTKVASLKPHAVVTWEGDGSVMVEDNLPETYEGRAMLASMLYGAFQGIANEAEKLQPQIIKPTNEEVAKIAIARS